MTGAAKQPFQQFLMIWAGEFISSVGSGITAFALGVYVYQATGAATSVALITLCAFLPPVLLGPLAGVLADRFDRRALMIAGDLSSTLGLAFILVCLRLGDAALWQIYIGVTFSAIFVSLLEPAYKATVTDLLTEAQFAKASGLVQLAGAAKYLVSPAIAGFMLMAADIQTVLAIDIATFLIASLVIFIVKEQMNTKKRAAQAESLAMELREGWNAIASNRGVFLLTMILSIMTFYVGFLQTLFTPMLLSFTDAATLGSVLSVCATGMVCSSLLISVFPHSLLSVFSGTLLGVFDRKHRYMRMMTYGICLTGFFFSLIGLTAEVHWITVAGFLFFFALPFINTSADVLIRTNIPHEAQGRAWGFVGILSQLGYAAAYALSGVLADEVFNPFLTENGLLASTIGQWIGTGQCRGIGLLFILSGALMMAMAAVVSKNRSIRMLEEEEKACGAR